MGAYLNVCVCVCVERTKMSCVQCKTGRARWQVENQPKHLFCTRACHATFMGLEVEWPGDEAGPEVHDPDVIGLETADGTKFRITREIAEKMITIKNLLEDVGPDVYIPLPESISASTLQTAINFLDGTPMYHVSDLDFLIPMLIAHNYLDIPSVYDVYKERIGPAWQLACRVGDAKFVEAMLNLPFIDPAAEDNYAIKLVSANGHAAVVELLLQDGRADPAANDNYAIRFASREGHAAVVELLLQDGRADPAVNDNYAIRLASREGHAAVVELLLQDGRADPASDYNYAIRLASANGYAEVVKLLLADPRVDPSTYNNSALRFASENGRAEVVKLLLGDPHVNTSGISLKNLRPDIRDLIEAHRRARARGETGDESGPKRATLGRRVK
jgi:hypothetical protein